MKKLLSISLISVLLFSCSKSNQINHTSASILGSWDLLTYTQEQITSYLDPIYGTEVILEINRIESGNLYHPDNWANNHGITALHTFTFRYDDTFTQMEILKDSSGNIIPNESSPIDPEYPWPYEKIGDTLLYPLNPMNLGLLYPYTITTLNNNSLSFQSTWLHSDNDNDTTFIYEFNEWFSFEKSSKTADYIE
jgi:hypothetical protein